MYSRISGPQTKLWVVTLGIVISLVIFTPPCFPLKASMNSTFEQVFEGALGFQEGSLKSRVADYIHSWWKE